MISPIPRYIFYLETTMTTSLWDSGNLHYHSCSLLRSLISHLHYCNHLNSKHWSPQLLEQSHGPHITSSLSPRLLFVFLQPTCRNPSHHMSYSQSAMLLDVHRIHLALSHRPLSLSPALFLSVSHRPAEILYTQKLTSTILS